MLLCFSGKDYSNLKYDALEGNRSQFFLQHKTRHPFRCRGTACTVDIYQRALRNHPSLRSTFREEYLFRRYLPTRPAEPPPPSFHIVKITCSVDIYQLVLRNLRPPLSTSSLRKLPPFLPAAGQFVTQVCHAFGTLSSCLFRVCTNVSASIQSRDPCQYLPPIFCH